MISKYEYLYAKKKKDDLKLKLANYEAKSNVYAMWKKWLAMSPVDQEKLMNDWSSYYKACYNSYYGRKFWEARKHFTNWMSTSNGEDKAKLLAIVQEVKTSTVPFLKTPSSVDPDELERRLRRYYEMKKKQQEYQDMFDEYEEIFEPKKSKGLDSL